MSTCNINHSLADVKQKLADQQAFLPEKLFQQTKALLSTALDQETLNEIFHLLKKYDLATTEEQMKRNVALESFVK